MSRRNPSEKDVKRGVKAALEEHHWLTWMPPANGFGQSGVSDRLALRDGVFMAVECKFGKNKPTEIQKKFLRDVLGHGGIAFCVNEVTLDAFRLWLRAFDRAQVDAETDKQVSQADGAIMVNTTLQLQKDFMQFSELETQARSAVAGDA